MRNVKVQIIVFFVFALCLSPALAAEKFDYEMAAPADLDAGYSFYLPASSDETLGNISGGQIRTIILCIGDGMGFNHVALARHETVGPNRKLHMERLPVAGVMRTCSVDNLITDSAAAVTAMACGVKTNNGMIGMTPDKVPHVSILEALQADGWRSGLVATSAITHATPAGFASHVDSRNKQKQIAAQMLDNHVDILLGGGKKFFLPKGIEKGVREDGRNLLIEAEKCGYQLVESRKQLLALNQFPVLGVFADEGMTTFEPEPSLAEMTRTAIKLLSKKDDGWLTRKPKFFVMIEGSQIDWASHANDTDRVIRQTLLFDMAVYEVIEFAKRDRHTLVIVTSDHETGGLVLKDKKKEIRPEWTSGSHTAADVPVYAFGPGSEQFAGVMDNTELSKRIAALTGQVPPSPEVIAGTRRSIP
ncbi:MAG: alkaline phosphatase [Planctomycetota bacterium]